MTESHPSPEKTPETPQYKREIRSFVRREGRLTIGQQTALDQHWARYGLELTQNDFFKKLISKPITLEIGFGAGENLLAHARHFPERNFLGLEVHRPGVGRVLAAAAAEDLNNIWVMSEDAVQVIAALPDGLLSEVQLFFPDPWHKARHHKRRLVQPEFATKLARVMANDGIWRLATDWENYAEQMRDVLNAHPNFKNVSPTHDFCPRYEHRPLTRFEARGVRLGHGVWDLTYSIFNP